MNSISHTKPIASKYSEKKKQSRRNWAFGVKIPNPDFNLRYNVKESFKVDTANDHKISSYRAFQYHRDFMSLIKTWDRGNRTVREQILTEFVETCDGKTAHEIDNELAGGGSLFLTRISAWLRLNYLTGTNLAIQIKGIRVFIGSAGGADFLNEFLEVGGVFSLLELLSLPTSKEIDKAEAIRLIHDIVRNGPKYRDFVCECFGIRSIAEYMIRCKSDPGADYGRVTLLLLGSGNSRYLSQLSCQGLRALLPNINQIHPSIVDATISLLRNPFYEVQHECCELIHDLVEKSHLQDAIISQLISRLKTVVDSGATEKDKDSKWSMEQSTTATTTKADSLLSSYVQQACSARLLGSLAVKSQDLAERMIELQCISGLLSAISNIQYPESQKNAVDTLVHLIDVFPRVAGVIKEEVGEEFFDMLKNSPDTFYRSLTKDQIQYLNRNSLKVRAGGRGDGQSGLGSNAHSDELFDEDPLHNINEKGRDDETKEMGKTGSVEEILAEAKKKDGGRMDFEQAKSRGVYIPFALSVGVTSNMTKTIEQDSEELDAKEATRIDTKKIEKKLASRLNELSISLTDLKEDVPHLLSLKDGKEVFNSTAQESINAAESLVKSIDSRPNSSKINK